MDSYAQPVRSRTWSLFAAPLLLFLALCPATGAAREAGSAPSSPWGVYVYRVESALYPFVHVYLRTFDKDKRPLVNLNVANVGLMVRGRSYDPAKRQYRIEPLRQRPEAIATVLVIDASGSMAGQPFEESLRAAARYIDSKRPQDQIAILAIQDTKEGYELVSPFERDTSVLGRRLGDIQATAKHSRIYDSIAAALQLAAATAQGAGAPSASNYVASRAIVVFSDGKDEGSALSRTELNDRITGLRTPIPIYAFAYSRVDRSHFSNLEALSKNSFGVYFDIGEAIERMQRSVEDVQHILQNDYVLTFRSYVPIDGESHPLKVGIEYPSGSGQITYASTRFEAIQPPPIPALAEQIATLEQRIPPLPDADPYLTAPVASGAN